MLTSAVPTLFMPVDENLRRYDQGYSNKVELTISESKYWNFVKRKILREGIDWPDSKKAFHKQWKKATRQIQQRPEVIYSRSFPLSSAVMALRLQQHYKVPWVMHLSDPWADSPVHTYSKKQYQYHKSLEKECLDHASYVCFTSELTVELYRNHYPQHSDKFLYFPNVYDEQDVSDNPYQFGEKIRVVYTGGLVGPRNISYLLNALEILQRNNPALLDQFEFVFAGEMDRQSAGLFQQHAFRNIQHLGSLSYGQSLALQRTADILLVIDNPIENPKHAVYFPSKILDYLMAKRRITAITTQGGTTDKILRSMNCITVEHHNAKGIVEKLEAVARAFSKQDKNYFKFDELPERFSARYNADRLKELIMNLTE